jgi:uncharacterized protein (TIGR02145 family)
MNLSTQYLNVNPYIFALWAVLIIGCDKQNTLTPPSITTYSVTDITETTAQSGGQVEQQDDMTIGMKGICWSMKQTPTVQDNLMEFGMDAGSFEAQLTGLQPNTTYYIRAYALYNDQVSYGNEVSFTTKEKGTDSTFTDVRDGKVYRKKRIGEQEWMAENMAYIPPSGSFWPYDNNTGLVSTYGYLYHWSTALNVCPDGWHLPNDEEWTVLNLFLGDSPGGKLKATGTLEDGNGFWLSPNVAATNTSGFTALPGGIRNPGGTYADIGKVGTWWSSSEANENSAWFRTLLYITGNVSRSQLNKQHGFSVRCIRD